MKDKKPPFNTWLYGEMEKRGWDALDLSIETGLSKQIIIFYLNGERLPTYNSLTLILDAFGMRMEFVDA